MGKAKKERVVMTLVNFPVVTGVAASYPSFGERGRATVASPGI